MNPSFFIGFMIGALFMLTLTYTKMAKKWYYRAYAGVIFLTLAFMFGGIR